jgi:uncharacterized protein (TIGR03905 family)
MTYEYITEGICPSKITFDIENEIVHDIKFEGGCDGNLKALSKIIDGMTVSEIEDKLGGITCGRKESSCSDQLAKAVKEAYNHYILNI